jgi:hypothetical protein
MAPSKPTTHPPRSRISREAGIVQGSPDAGFTSTLGSLTGMYFKTGSSNQRRGSRDPFFIDASLHDHANPRQAFRPPKVPCASPRRSIAINKVFVAATRTAI